MSRRTPQALRFIDDEQIDAGPHRLLRQLRAIDQHFDGDHRAAVKLERVEVGAKITRHVGEAIRVEQCEHLMVFSPKLAQPLHRERVRSDDKTTSHLSGVHQPVEDQRCLDGFSEPDFVRQ